MKRKAIAVCSFALLLIPAGALARDEREFTDTFPLGEQAGQAGGAR